MEVMPGYKRTEVGVIPQDWGIARIGDIAVVNGGFAFSSKAFLPSGRYQIVKMSNLYGGNLDLDRSASYLNALTDEQKRYLLCRDEIIVTLTGTTGKRDYGYSYKIDNEQNLLLNQRVGRLVVCKSADPGYVAFQLRSPCFLEQFFELSKGGTGNQTNVSTQDVAAMRVPLPPLPEQCAIAAALTDVDALLGGLDHLIAKKRDLKQAAMQQLLTAQTRLPGFYGEWEVKQLGDVGRCLRGVSYRGDGDLAAYDTAKTKRLLRANNVQNAIVVTNDVQYVNADRVSWHQILQPDDILVCMANGSKALVGKAALFNITDGQEYTFGAFMGCFRTDARVAHAEFVFALFQTGKYRDYINNLLAGSSINNLRPSSVESLPFRWPSLQEQIAIATVLSDMDAELLGLISRRDKTGALKQGMMQELLTGKTRLVPVGGADA